MFPDVPAYGSGEKHAKTSIVTDVPVVTDENAEVRERLRSIALVPIRFIADMHIGFLVVAAMRSGERVGFGTSELADKSLVAVFDVGEVVAMGVAARSGRAFETTLAEWIETKRTRPGFVLTERSACGFAAHESFTPEPDRPHYWNDVWCPDGWTLRQIFEHFELHPIDVVFAPIDGETPHPKQYWVS